jgi:hypothetical protein
VAIAYFAPTINVIMFNNYIMYRPSVQYQAHKSKCADSPDGDDIYDEITSNADSANEPVAVEFLSSTKEECSEKPIEDPAGVAGNTYTV